MDSKVERAVELIKSFRDMKTEDLNALIVAHAGQELSAFFLNYARQLLAQQPGSMSAATLMLMGYLIRADEEKLAPPKGMKN